MKRIVVILVLLVMYGCGSNQTDQTETVTAQTEQKQDPYVSTGIALLKEGRAAEAIQSFDEAIKHNPTDANRYMILAHTYMRLKNYARAIDTYSAALRYSDNKGEVYYLLAVCYGLTGNQAMTQESIEKSIEIFTRDRDEENLVKALAFVQNLQGGQQVEE